MKIKNLRYSLSIMGLAIPLVLSGCNDKINQQLGAQTVNSQFEQEISNLELKIQELEEEKNRLEEEKNIQNQSDASSKTETDEVEKKRELKDMSDKYDGVYRSDLKSGNWVKRVNLIEEYIKSETEFLEVLDEIEEVRKSYQDRGWSLDKSIIEFDLNISEYSKETITRFNKFLIDLGDIISLSASNINLEDMSFLDNVSKIENLYLNNCNIKDITFLSDITTLKMLSLRDNEITDITSLAGLTDLMYLDLSGNYITNLVSVGSLTNLKQLLLNNNNITDIYPLWNLNNLEYLHISYNNISDIQSVVDFMNSKPNTKVYFEELTSSYTDENNSISDNNLNSISGNNIEKQLIKK